MSFLKRTKQYKAFISYNQDTSRSHVEVIEEAVKEYSRKFSFISRPVKLFRDKNHIEPGNSLSAAIKKALDNSDYLILFASEKAAKSDWVRMELEYWCASLGRAEQLIILLSNGTIVSDSQQINWKISSALPDYLKTYIQSEPIYQDIRWITKESVQNPEQDKEFKNVIKKITAKILGIKPVRIEEIEDKTIKKHTLIRNTAIIVLTILFISALFLLWYSSIQLRRARSNALAANSISKIQENPTLAYRLAEESYLLDNNNLTAHNVLLKSYYAADAFYSILYKHKNELRCVSFSQNGEQLIAGGQDGAVILFDLKKKTPKLLQGHSDRVNSAIFSTDTKYVLTAGADGQVIKQSLDGMKKWIFDTDLGGEIDSIAFSPNKRDIIIANKHTVLILDEHCKIKKQFTGKNYQTNSSFVSRDGKYIIIPNSENNSAIIDQQNNKKINFSGYIRDGNAAAVSNDGKYIVTLHENRMYLYDMNKGVLNSLNAHENALYINHVSFSPDGNYLITSSSDRKACIWELSGKLKWHLKGHERNVHSVAFSPNMDSVATVSGRFNSTVDNTLRFWQLKEKSLTVFKGDEPVYFASFSPNGNAILTAQFDTPVLIDLSGNILKRFDGIKAILRSGSFSPDGKQIVLTCYSSLCKNVFLVESSTGNIRLLKGHKRRVNSAIFSPDGAQIITTSSDGAVLIWNSKTLTSKVFKKFEFNSHYASFSPDGKKIIVLNWDDKIRYFKVDGSLIKEVDGHTNGLAWSNISPDGKRIVTVSNDNILRILDFNGNEMISIKGRVKRFYTAQFSHNGQYLLTSDIDNKIKLWPLNPEVVMEIVNKEKRFGDVWKLDEESRTKYGY